MIQNLVTYLEIGIIIMFSIDIISILLLKNADFIFSNRQRISAILLWPILVFGLILGLIKR